MEVFYIEDLSNLPKTNNNTCVIGTFDGLHIGHQQLIKKAQNFGLKTLLITFDNQRKTNYFLTTTEQKYNLMSVYGVDYLIVFPFELIKGVKYTEFISMLEKLNVKNLICGADFRFGSNREGSISNLEEHFNVSVSDYTLFDGERVSSSIIKEFITTGNLNKANEFLGRNYSLVGKVLSEEVIGDILKLEFDYHLHLLPPNGVYKTITRLADLCIYSETEITNITKTDKRIYVTLEKGIYNILNKDIEILFI